MSTEDPTRPMPGGGDTKPSLEAVIHRIDRLGALVLERLGAIENNQANLQEAVAKLQEAFAKLDVRLDRIESEVKQTHSELYTLRADFKEFRAHFKEPA